MPEKKKLLAELFGVFFKIGAFTFGGGYAMIPFIQREMVEHKKWIDEDELLDIISEGGSGYHFFGKYADRTVIVKKGGNA